MHSHLHVHSYTSLIAHGYMLGMNTSLLQSFEYCCKLKNCTTATLKCYAERMSYLLRYAHGIGKDIDALTRDDIQAYILSIMEKVSAETVNGRIRVYRTFFKHLHEEGLIATDPMAKIKMLRGERRLKKVLSVEDLAKVLGTFDRKNYNGARDYLMILLSYDSILRLNELLSIKLSEIDLTRKLVTVHGKGRKDRIVPFSDRTAKGLHLFLMKHRKGVPGDLLFPRRDGTRLQTRRAHRIFCLAGRKVGIYLHPHLLRHSGATQFCANGGNAAVLQRLLGHSSLVITQRYINLSTGDLSAAYERFSPLAGLTG